MASKTQVTESRCRRKIANKGKTRKRALRRNGSTPSKAELFGDK